MHDLTAMANACLRNTYTTLYNRDTARTYTQTFLMTQSGLLQAALAEL